MRTARSLLLLLALTSTATAQAPPLKADAVQMTPATSTTCALGKSCLWMHTSQALRVRKADGTDATVSGGGGSGTIDSVTGTAPIVATGDTDVIVSHAASGITAATYGSASAVPVCAYNATGHATSCTSTAIAISAAAVTSGTLPVARGGTNATAGGSLGSVPCWGSGDAYAFTAAPGSANSILHGNPSGTGVATWGAVNLASADVTGVTPIANGGTGSATRTFVQTTGDETVAGVKTFSSVPVTAGLTGPTSTTMLFTSNQANGSSPQFTFSSTNNVDNFNPIIRVRNGIANVLEIWAASNQIYFADPSQAQILYMYGWTAVRPFQDHVAILGGPAAHWLQVHADRYAERIGANLSSATTIVPTAGVHHVTGTATIATITVPASFLGSLTLIPDGLWSLTTGGNVARAVAAVVGQPIRLTYDGTSWYPDTLDTQPLDADLTAMAALSSTAGMLARTGAGAFAVRTLACANSACSFANGDGAAGAPTLTIANPVPAASGAGAVLYSDGAAWARLAAGADGQCLLSNGAAPPEWGACAEGASNETLTLGVGLTGSSYNGSSPVSTAVDQAFAPTWTGVHNYAAGKLKVDNDSTTNAHLMASLATQARTWTLPDASDTACGIAATQTLTNKTLTTPTIASFANANHNHTDSASGGDLTTGGDISGPHDNVVVEALQGTAVSNATPNQHEALIFDGTDWGPALVSLVNSITGTLAVPNGGTGLATLLAHALYVGNGTSAPVSVAVGATGTVLAGATAADPAFTATPTVTTMTCSTSLVTPLLDRASSGALAIGTTNATSIALQQNVTVPTAKTLVVGANTLFGAIADKLAAIHLAIASQAVGDLLVADGTTSFARLGLGSKGRVLHSNGTTVVYSHAITVQAALTPGTSGTVDTTVLTFPACTGTTNGALLGHVVVRVTQAIDSSANDGQTVVTVGDAAGDAEYLASWTIVEATGVGTVRGLKTTEVGSAFTADNMYNALANCGTSVIVRTVTSNDVDTAALLTITLDAEMLQ